MDRDTAVALVKQGVGYRADKSTEIIAALDAAVLFHEQGDLLPWFLEVEDLTRAGTANSGALTLPTDFIRETDDGALWFTATTGRFDLRKMSYDKLISLTQSPVDGSAPTGSPLYYALRKDTIQVRPIPTSAWTAYLSYYAHDILPSTFAGGGSTNVWLTKAPYVIVNWAGMKMAGDFRDPDAVKNFGTAYTPFKQRLDNEIIARADANNEYHMGGEN